MVETAVLINDIPKVLTFINTSVLDNSWYLEKENKKFLGIKEKERR